MFATSRVLPRRDLDTPLLVAALRRRGITAGVACWDDPNAAWDRAGAVIIRSTWDYTGALPAFLAWADATASATAVRNDPATVRWNADKRYLLELSARGVAIPPTRLVEAGEPLRLTTADLGADGRVVVKPTVGGGARGASLGDARDPGFEALALAALGGHAALVQPFDPSIAAGERSLLFASGRFTHAVVKRPAAGDWRVQHQYGGTAAPWSASPAERAMADAALAAVPAGVPLIARVDLVGGPDAPLLMELEAIEPELFLPGSPGAVDAFADAFATLA